MRAAIYSNAREESHCGDLFGDGEGEQWRLRYYITIKFSLFYFIPSEDDNYDDNDDDDDNYDNMMTKTMDDDDNGYNTTTTTG